MTLLGRLAGIPALERRLDQILKDLNIIKQQEVEMAATLAQLKAKADELQASVNGETDLGQSIVTLLEGLNAQLAAVRQQLQDAINGGDPAAVQAVLDTLAATIATNEANKARLVAAVTANTPSA